MKRGFILGILFVMIMLFVAGSVMAGPKQCPPGQRDNCNTWIQNQTGNEGCFPVNANPQGYTFLHSGCKEEIIKKATNTATVEPRVGLTNTPLPDTPLPDKDTGNGKSFKTPTLTCEECNNEDPRDCICEIADNLATQNALIETQNAILGE